MSVFCFQWLPLLDQKVGEPNYEAAGENTQNDPKPQEGVRTNVFWRKHWIRAAGTALAGCNLTVVGLKAIAVMIAVIVLANVRLRVKILVPLGACVLTAAPAANSFFTASCGAIRILFARVALTDELTCELSRLLINT